MDLFQSFYDTNHDGSLTGFERTRYEDSNYAYVGSLVPDLLIEQEERRRSSLFGDDETSGDYGTTSRFEAEEDDGSDWDMVFLDDMYEPESYVLDNRDDFGPEEQFWFAPKNRDDLFRALDTPKYLEAPRIYAHRCYNCKHWDEMAPTINTRDYGCEIWYDKDIDRDLDNCPPDEDGEVCKRFNFRHKKHGQE